MKRPVDVERTFQRSMGVTVSAASLVLASAEGAWWPCGLTPLFALISYLFVDRRQRWKLSVLGANLLGVAAFAAMTFEFYGNNLFGKLLSGAHLLVYMTWVVLFLKKGIRQYWWLAALSVLQISVASILTTEPSFGAALIGMLMLMIWTLSVFSLYRAKQRIRSHADQIEDSLNQAAQHENAAIVEVKNGLQLDREERWIGVRFYGITSFAFVASLMIGVVAFAVFPRFWVPQSVSGLDSIRQALPARTGFTESVSLGEIGEIMQSDQRVLHFQISTMKDGRPVDPSDFADVMKMDEIMFRGNALGRYQKGRWTSGATQGKTVGDLEMRNLFRKEPRASDYRITITQDPPIAKFAFAPSPVMNARVKERRGTIEKRQLSYSLIHKVKREKHRAEPLTYEIWCAKPAIGQVYHSPRQVNWSDVASLLSDSIFRSHESRLESERRSARDWCITRNLKEDLPQLHAVANRICTQNGKLLSEEMRVRKITSYLNASGQFQYSHALGITDPDLDPIEDFLINRHTGHCEYFASAGALMLQAVDVPARVVNGYKGCEENSVTGRWEVKQKHAHAWAEAFVDGRWITFDPTPAAAREENVAQTDTFDWWSDMTTAMRDGWFSAVQKMSLQQQEAMVRPLLAKIQETWKTIQERGIWESLSVFYHEVILQPGKWMSWRTGVVTFVLLLIPGVILQRSLHHRMTTFLRSLVRWTRPADRQQRAVVRFYENFCTLCSKHGLTLRPNQTAQENAELAVDFFAEKLRSADELALPGRIAKAFNSVRFGDHVLTANDIAAVRSDVDFFGTILDGRDIKATHTTKQSLS